MELREQDKDGCFLGKRGCLFFWSERISQRISSSGIDAGSVDLTEDDLISFHVSISLFSYFLNVF